MQESKKKIYNIIAMVAIILIVVMCLLITKSEKISKITAEISKTIKYIQGQNFVTQSDNQEIVESKIYNVYMLINELHQEDNISVSGSKVKMTFPEELTISVYDILTSDEISLSDNGILEIPQNGIKLKIDGIEDGKILIYK